MPIAANIYYYAFESEKSKNPPVVLLHGAGGNYLSWPPEVRRLAGCNVYSVDLPGHGKSNGPGEQTIEAYVQHIFTWMQAANLPRAIVIGHSMGGAIAMALRIQYPAQVIGLGLIGTGARLPVNPTLLEDVASPVAFQSTLKTITKWSFSKEASPKLVDQVSKRLAIVRPSVLHGDFLACSHFDLVGKLGQIICPTLVICGDKDKMTPLRYSQLLANRIPPAQLSIIPDAGHMVMLEKPQAVANALLGFIDDNSLFMH